MFHQIRNGTLFTRFFTDKYKHIFSIMAKISSLQIRHAGNFSTVKTQENALSPAKCATSTPTVL